MTFIESETIELKSSVVADLLLYNTKTRKTISVDAEPYRKHTPLPSASILIYLSDKWGAVLLFY